MNRYKIELTFIQPILGTVPKDKSIYGGPHGPGKDLEEAMLAEELATIQESEDKGWTGFHTLPDGTPILYDYAVKGFFKDACSMLKRVPDTKSGKLTAFKKIIDGLVFVEPRQIPLVLNGAEMDTLERPLRAQTAQGERVALARSDTCPVGTKLKFEVSILGGVDEKTLREWLDYGRFRGLGQWRNGGYGAFTYEIEAAA